MPQLYSKKTIALGFVIIFLAVFAFWQIKKPADNHLKNIAIPVAANPHELAQAFPKEIALNKLALIMESYSFKNPSTGKITESTAIFQSNDSLENNKQFYENWAKEDKWLSANYSKRNDSYTLQFSKENKIIIMDITKISKNSSKVSIVYREIDKKALDKKVQEQFKNIKL